MLNNKKRSQKTKNQLVFKLLKTMNPYIQNAQNNNSAIKDQLASIISLQQKQHLQEQERQNNFNSMIKQLSQQYDHEHNQEEIYDKKNMKDFGDIVRGIASRVVDINVFNGNWLQMKHKIQNQLERQVQESDIKSGRLRKQIQNIQTNVFKQFNIKKQLNIRQNKYSIANSSPINNFIDNYNTNSHTSKGMYQSACQNNNFSSINRTNHLQNIKKFPKTTNNQRYNSNKSKNSDILVDRFESRQVQMHKQQKLKQISQRFSRLRQNITQLQSPIKSYRYQTDQFNKNISSVYLKNLSQQNWQNKKQLRQQKQQMNLGLVSKVSQRNSINNHRISKSKSQAVISGTRIKGSQSTKIDLNAGGNMIFTSHSTTNMRSSHRPVSQRVIKQARKLDDQVISCLLHSKIRGTQKSNTIASLIK